MKEKTKKKRHPITLVIILIALAVMIFALVKIGGIYKDYQESEKTFQTLESEYVINPNGGTGALWQDGTRIQFEELQKENPDIKAWLRFDNYDDVHISYPILYSGDDDTYLRSDIYGNYHIAGCIFLEGLNHPDFSDYHSIVYGHNMRNLSMFGKLKQFRDQAVFDSDAYFWVYTPEKIYKYEIFSCQEVGATSETYQLQFSDKKKFQEYIDSCFERSVLKRDIEVTSDDKIVTLSTCTGNSETRFLVQGKLIETYKAV